MENETKEKEATERRGTSELTCLLYPLWLRTTLGYIFKVLTPGYSCCHRCERPWSIAEHHSTRYTENRGCFPLCELCWQELEPKDRLPYYRELYNEWQHWSIEEDETWKNIKEAVLAGK